MKTKPVHSDIKKFGYFLQYSKSEDCWYASYSTDKADVWYKWSGKNFDLIIDERIPNDLIYRNDCTAEDVVHSTIDEIRQKLNDFSDPQTLQRISNYIEANINKFIEYYEGLNDSLVSEISKLLEKS